MINQLGQRNLTGRDSVSSWMLKMRQLPFLPHVAGAVLLTLLLPGNFCLYTKSFSLHFDNTVNKILAKYLKTLANSGILFCYHKICCMAQAHLQFCFSNRVSYFKLKLLRLVPDYSDKLFIDYKYSDRKGNTTYSAKTLLLQIH